MQNKCEEERSLPCNIMYIVHKTVTILLYSCLLSRDSVPAAREAEDVQVAGLLWCYMQCKTMTSTGEIILYITPSIQSETEV